MTAGSGRDALPLVSVLVPCYNGQRFLRDTLRSIFLQTYRPIEVVVWDDGSTDRSREILASFGERILWGTGPNRGDPSARNRALALSHGAFVCFHDVDDRMAPEKIERQVATALAHPGAVTYGPWRHVWKKDDGTEEVLSLRMTEPFPAGTDLLQERLRWNICPPISQLWPREVLEKLGPWDESLFGSADADYVWRAMLAGVPFVYSPDSWVDYMGHPKQLSAVRTGQSLRCRARGIRKVVRTLREQGRLDRYRDAIAWRLDRQAQIYWRHYRAGALWCAREARRISGKPTAVGSPLYRALRRVLGLTCAENLRAVTLGIRRRLLRA